MANRFRQMYSIYQQNRDLIRVGAYQKGSDAEIDQAIEWYPRLCHFLKQGIDQKSDWAGSLQGLTQLVSANSGSV